MRDSGKAFQMLQEVTGLIETLSNLVASLPFCQTDGQNDVSTGVEAFQVFH